MSFNRYASYILTFLYVVGITSTLIIFFLVMDFAVLSVSFWISLIAILLAETALWWYAVYMMQRLDSIRPVLPGYLAIGVVIAAYLAAVIFYSFFSGIADLALKWYVVIHLVTFVIAVFLIGLLLIFNRSHEDDDDETKAQIVKLHSIVMALQQLQHELKSHNGPLVEEIDQLVSALIEDVTYSDPITPKAIANHDHLLLKEVHQVNEELTLILPGNSSSYQAILKRLQDFKLMLEQRNAQILLAK